MGRKEKRKEGVKHALKKNFQTQGISERQEFIENKDRDKGGTASSVGQQLLTGQEELTFCGLIADL